MIEREVTIINKLGLHARAASKLVNCASAHAAEVWIRRDEREVNAKSIMGVLTLAASQGTVLGIRTNGRDEEVAMQAIVDLVSNYFGEGE